MAGAPATELLADPCDTLVRLVERRAALQPDQAAYTFLDQDARPGEVLTYGELAGRARSIAAQLQARLARGARVLLVYSNEPGFVCAFTGCLFAGVIAVPVAPPRNPGGMARLVRIAEAAGAELVLCAASLRRALARLRPPADDPAVDWLFDDDLAGGVEDRWAAPEIDTANTAVLQFTSGSTGNPKGVMLSHANILHNCRLLRDVCGASADLKLVTWLPFFHDWGLFGCLIFPLYVGRPCLIIDPRVFLYRPLRWLEAISRHRVTISCAPNFAYELCLDAIAADGPPALDLGCWEMAMVGAEPVRKETLERFAAAFAPCGFRRDAFFPCYGLAESTLIVSGGARAAPPVHAAFDRAAMERGRVVAAPDSAAVEAKELVGCGRPLANLRLRIVDAQTLRPAAPDTIGEIWVAGPSVAQGYWGAPEITRQTFAATAGDGSGDRYLRTGDLGFLWRDELFVCGRLKDVIIKAGANYFAEDIERSAARGHPGLRADCGAAFSVDVAGQERLVVVQELKYGRKPDLGGVIGCIQKAVADDHDVLADAIVLIRPGSLDKTPSGKIRRQHTKAQFLAGGLQIEHQWRDW